MKIDLRVNDWIYYAASDVTKILLCLWAFTMRGSNLPSDQMKSMEVLFSPVALFKLFLCLCL